VRKPPLVERAESAGLVCPPVDDPDVHLVGSLEAEAPFDQVAVDGGDVAGLLMPGGIAIVAGAAGAEPGLASVPVDGGHAIAVRYRL
jgi:hypothetical protein